MITSGVGSPLKILLVVDSSPHSMAAVDLLSHMTWPVGTSADVLVPVPERLPHISSPPGAHDALAETAELARWRDWAAAKILAIQVANQLQAHHLRVTTEICEGQPAKLALEHTAVQAANLIVIGAKGLTTPDKVPLDPAVYDLANEADCSILIARPSPQVRPLSTILAVDGSPQTWRIVEFLAALSLPDWAKVSVVSVIEEKEAIPAAMASISGYVSPGMPRIAQPTLVGVSETYEAEVYGAEVIRYLHESGAQGWSMAPVGNPANEILNAAKQQNAVLIVLGACGHTCAQPFRLGGVAQRVIKEAACSVLVIR